MQHDAFACHNSKDKPAVRKIRDALVERGASVWIDEHDIQYGDEYWWKIAGAMQDAQVHLVFLGPQGLGRVQRKEISVILGLGRCIIPIVLPGASFDEVLKGDPILTWLGGVNHAVNFTAGITAEVLDKLASAILTPHPPTPAERRQRAVGRQQIGVDNLPRRNRFFTGRAKEMRQIEQQLAKASFAVLSGFGGTGKTGTAVEFAYRRSGDYRHQFFVLAEKRSDLLGGFIEIGRLLGLEHEADVEETVRAVIDWLGKNDGWLLIFDNADSDEMLGDLTKYLPSTLPGHVLVTTRRQTVGPLADYGVAKPIEIVDLLPSDAVEFLARRTEREFDGDEHVAAVALAQELGYLAIALEQAAAYLVEHGMLVADYLDAYRRRTVELKQSLLDEISPQTGGRHERPLATTWLMNFEEVEKESPAAAELLNLFAFLHADAIPMELIASATGEDDPIALNKLFELLRRYSLVRYDAVWRILSIHRLVQQVLLAKMGVSARREKAAAAISVIAAAFPSVEFKNWSKCERLVLHVLMAADWIEQYTIESYETARLLNGIGLFLWHQGRYDEAGPLYLRSLAIWEEVLGDEHHGVADIFNNLALLYTDQGRYDEAEPLYLRSLAIWEEALGDEHPSVGMTLSNLANLYSDQGRYDEAEPLSRIIHEMSRARIEPLRDLLRL